MGVSVTSSVTMPNMSMSSCEPATPTGGPVLAERPLETPVELVTWVTIVWDDPVNLMSYVTYVFRTYFGYSHERAHALMMAVHTEGRAVVAEGGREPMESHVAALHAHGLWATLERAD